MFDEPPEQVLWLHVKEPLCRGSFVETLLHEVVNDCSCLELSFGQAMVTVVEEAEVAVAAFNGGTRALKELSALLDGVGEHNPVVVTQRREEVSDLLGRGHQLLCPLAKVAALLRI